MRFCHRVALFSLIKHHFFGLRCTININRAYKSLFWARVYKSHILGYGIINTTIIVVKNHFWGLRYTLDYNNSAYKSFWGAKVYYSLIVLGMFSWGARKKKCTLYRLIYQHPATTTAALGPALGLNPSAVAKTNHVCTISLKYTR